MQNRWEISINGGPKLDGVNLNMAVHELGYVNRGAGSAAITFRRKADEPFLLNAGNGATPPDCVRLYRDGVCVWVGPVTKSRKIVQPSGLRHHHDIGDPWRILETTNFLYWYTRFAPTAQPCSQAGWQIARDVWAALPEAAKWAQIEPWQPSLQPIFYDEWMNTNGPFSNVLATLLQPSIMAATRWDFSTTPPTLKVMNQGDEVITLDVDRDCVSGSIDLAPRMDLVPAGVALMSQSSVEGFGPMEAVDYFVPGEPQSCLWPLTATAGSERVLTLLAPAKLTVADCQAGAARALYEALSHVIWEGQIIVNTQRCRFDVRPGATLNLASASGGDSYDPAWASMNAVVQRVTLDAMTNRLTIQVGSSGTLEPGDVFQRARNLFGMYPFNGMGATHQHHSSMVVTPGPGLGRLGSVAVRSLVNVTLGGGISVVAQAGVDGFAGTTAVDIAYPVDLFPAAFTVSLPASPTWGATVSMPSPGIIRISIATVPSASTFAEWTITVA
jgi:hypothetical protein